MTEHADAIAKAIQKAAENEGSLSELSRAEKDLIRNSPQAQQVLEEFISDGSGKGRHGGEVQDWVKNTRRSVQLNNAAGMLRAQTMNEMATGRKAQNRLRIETGNLTSTASVQRNVAGAISRAHQQTTEGNQQGGEQTTSNATKTSRGVRVDGDFGNIVTIDAINGDGSVTMTVEINGEQQVKNSSAVEGFGSEAIGAMVDYAGATGRMNAGALNTMINGWQSIDGVELGDYMTTMADAYNAGYLGRELTTTGNGVVDSLARNIFDQAKQQRSQEDAKRVQTARELGPIAKVGNLNIDNAVYDLLGADMDGQGNLVDRDGVETGTTREQLKSQVQLVAAMAQVIGNKWGTNVRLVSPQNIDGVDYITNNDGTREVWKGQGYFDPKTNELVLSVTAQEQNIHGAMVSNVITTMTHEITHALEKMGGQAYNDFRNEVLSMFGRNQAQLDRMIDAKMAQYRANGVTLDYKGALDEIVAESASMMLQNSKVVRDFYLRNATLAEKVRGIMSRFLEKVKSAFNGLSTRNSEASMLWDQQAGRYVGNLQELWDNAFLASTAARNADGSLTDEARRTTVTRTVTNEHLAANLGSMVGEDGRQFSLGADIGKLAMGVKVKFGDLIQSVNNAIFKSRLANMPGPVAEVFTDAADHAVADITGTGGVDLGDGAKMELRDDGLVAVHGLSVNNLVEQFTNWGGMPMPSIGVYGVKNMPNHRWFNGAGRAFVMFGQDIIDPAMNEKNALYEKDAFTTMVRYTDKENALPVRMDLVDRFMDVNKVYDDASLRQALNGIAECIPRDMKLKDNPKEFRRRIAEALQSDDMRVPNGLYITKLGAVAKLYEAMNGNKNAIEYSGNEDFYTDKHDNPKSIAKIAKWVADTLYNPNTSGQSTAKTVFDQLKLQAPSVTGTPRVDLDTARANQTAENPVYQYAEAKPGYIIQPNMLRAVGLPTSMQGHAIVETMRNAGVHVEFFDDSVDGAAVEAIKNVAMTTAGAQFNLGSMQADMQTYRQMLAPLVQDGTMSMMEVDNLFGTIATAMDYIEQHTDILDFGAQFTRENRGFTPIKDNSDPLYKVSLDFSTLCKKRLLQQTIQDRLEARLAMERNARAGERTVLSPQERAAIRESLQNLREQGLNIDVACGLCYVEAARLKAPAQMERFLKDPEFYIRKGILDRNGDLNKKRNAYRQARIPELLSDLESRMDTLSPADQAKVKDARQQLEDGKRPTKKMLPKAAQEQLYQEIRSMEVGLTNDELAEIAVVKELGQDAFTTSEGLTRLRHEHPIVWEAFSTYIRNATHSKGLEGDVPFYAGDTYARMGDQMIANMNKENGMRAQSWSDFQLYHILDYIGATIELATRGVKMQTYTKVPAFLELMGRTGAMINMSLIPKTDSATLDFDPVEGMDYDTSRKYRDLFHGNVGNILIGVSDAQIRSALANIGIDYIIPYHASGLSGEMQKRMGLKNWKSYQNWQSEKVPKGQKATSVSDWFDLQEAKRIQQQRQAEYDRGRESIRDRYFELTGQAEQAMAAGDDARAMQLYDEARATGYDATWGARQAMQAMGDRYLALCRERGITPKFSTIRHSGSNEVTDLTREEGYWKLLIDRKMIDNITGEIIEQQALKPNFDQSRLMRIMEEEVNRYTATEADRAAAIAEIDRLWESGEIQRMASSEHLKELVAKQEAAAVQISAVESAKDVQRNSGRQLNLGSDTTTAVEKTGDDAVQYAIGSEQSSVRDFLMEMDPSTLRTQAEKEILRRYREASGKMQEIRRQMDEIQGRLNENAYENEIARKQDQNRMVVLRNQLERQNDIILEMEGNNGLGQMVRNVQNVLQHELAGLDHDGLDASIRELQAREADIQERLKADIKNLPKIDQLREIAKIYYKPAVLDQMARSLRRGGGMSTDEVRRSVYELAIAWAEMSANIDDGVKSAKAAERFNARVAALANNAVDNQVSSTALSELQDEIADSDVNLPLSLNDAEVAALKEHGVSVAEYARMIGMVGRVHVNHQARTTYAEDNWWNNNTDHNLDEDVVTPVSAIFGQLSYGDAAYGPWQVYEKFAAARAAEDNMMYPYGENVKDGQGYKTRGEAVAAATADIVNQLVSDGLPNFNAANISDAGKLAQMIAAVGARFQSNLDTRRALEERLAQSERAMETYATLRGGVTDSAIGMVGYLMDYADRVSQSYAETTLAEADTWR